MTRQNPTAVIPAAENDGEPLGSPQGHTWDVVPSGPRESLRQCPTFSVCSTDSPPDGAERPHATMSLTPRCSFLTRHCPAPSPGPHDSAGPAVLLRLPGPSALFVGGAHTGRVHHRALPGGPHRQPHVRGDRLRDDITPDHELRGVGGSTELDRAAVAHLPVEEAAAELEHTFPERVAGYLRAFVTRNPRPTPLGNGQPGRSRAARLHRLLAERTGEAKGQVTDVVAVTRRRCLTCSGRLPALARSDARYCSVRCRVAAYRVRVA